MLERIKSQRPVAKILPPADEGVLRRFLDRLGMAIPGDYVELLRDTDGFAVDAWQFHGTKARKIVRDDSNYYLVAEDPEHALCLREGQTLAEVIYYDQIDDEVTVMGRSFVEALLEVTQATDLEGS